MQEIQSMTREAALPGVSERMQKAIEDQVVALAQGVTDCLEGARAAAPQNPYDRTRSEERQDAVHFIGATAQLLHSIAKLRGEFQYNYNINRTNAAADTTASAPSRPKWPDPAGHTQSTYPYLGTAEINVLTIAEYNAYEDAIADLPSARRRGSKNQEDEAPKNPLMRDERAEPEEEITRAQPVPPLPPEDRGSNTDG